MISFNREKNVSEEATKKLVDVVKQKKVQIISSDLIVKKCTNFEKGTKLDKLF